MIAALLLQPVFGYIHHRRHLGTQKPSAWTGLHIWYGRVLVLLGILNGWLGLQLASGSPAYSRSGMIVYSVLAALAALALLLIIIAVSVWPGWKKKGEKQRDAAVVS